MNAPKLCQLFLATLVLAVGFPAATVHAADAPRAAGSSLLTRALEMYDDQRYEESIQVLSAALVRPGSPSSEKIALYKLMAQNYILLRKDDEAESAFRALLALSPEFRMPASESPRFRVVFEKVRAKWEAEGRPGVIRREATPPADVKLSCKGEGVAKNGERYALDATLSDPDARAKRLSLFARTGGKGKFVVAWQGPAHGGKSALSILPPGVKAPLLEYYVEADDLGGLALASCGDATQPFRVAVPETKSGSWVPWAVGGVVGAGLLVGGLALAGVFKSEAPTAPTTRIHIGIGEAP